jgi:cytoskeletal protein CcmA (bactofilin family)
MKGDYMLKNKKFEKDKDPETSKLAEQNKFSMSDEPDTTDKKTVIGENTFIEGSIRGDENLVIEGSMKGNIEIEKHNFTVGPKGRVEGEIKARSVSVSGQMIGNINTKGKVEITQEADFMGDIKAKSISVETGAYFKGSIELDKEPQRKTEFTGKSTTVASTQPINEPKTPIDKDADKEN